MIEMTIRAGTTGAPDKLEQQESWGKILPIIQGLVQQIMQVRAANGNADPFINLLKETIKRFDERLDVEQFIAQASTPAMPPGLPAPAGSTGISMPPHSAQMIPAAPQPPMH